MDQIAGAKVFDRHRTLLGRDPRSGYKTSKRAVESASGRGHRTGDGMSREDHCVRLASVRQTRHLVEGYV
jgi:hypothetical protein